LPYVATETVHLFNELDRWMVLTGTVNSRGLRIFSANAS